MSKWMISHAIATILTPIILPILFAIVLALYDENRTTILDGVWGVIFIVYVFLFIMFPIFLFFKLINISLGKKRFIAIPILMIFVGCTIELVFYSENLNIWPEFLLISGIGVVYTIILYISEVILEKAFNITNEDWA